MNNHGEIGGTLKSNPPDRTQQQVPCGSLTDQKDIFSIAYVNNYYQRPVVIQKDGSVSVKTPPLETMGQYSFDNTSYRVVGMNDNGDYILTSLPEVSVRNGYDVTVSVLGHFIHEYKDGAYITRSKPKQHRFFDLNPSDCHRDLEYKDAIAINQFGVYYNNTGLFVGSVNNLVYWTSGSTNVFKESFSFVGSFRNKVNFIPLYLNQNNLIIGRYHGYGNPNYLFEGTHQYNIPNNIGQYKFRGLSSPEENEALMLLASYHLAIQKRDPQTGDLVPLSNGADAYAVTTAEQVLHQPDANGNSTQNAEWSSPYFTQISDNGNFIAGSANKNGVRHAVLWVKMDIGSDTEEAYKNKHVYRGDPLRNWASHSTDLNIPNTNVSGPIASHPTLGDYVHYKAYHPGLDSSLITNYKWSAVPVDGYNNLTTIEGPDDASACEWKIEDGGVDWKSGKYNITLELTVGGGATATVTKEQTVWQRTDDVLVVAYIDSFFDPIPDGATARPIRNDMDGDVEAPYTMAEFLSPLRRAAFFLNLASGGYRTPFEPDVARRYLNRFVLQETANADPPADFQRQLSDELSVYDEAKINEFFSKNTNYRAINRLQAEYLLDESGDIVQGPEIITKLAYLTNIGDTPPLEFAAPQSSPEVHPDSGVINTDGSTYDFHHVIHSIGVPQGFAQYASGRVGSSGQFMNSMINGGDTPWIYGLIEFKGDAYGPEHRDIVRQIFPTYWIYVNGERIENFPQSDPELFIQLGNSL